MPLRCAGRIEYHNMLRLVEWFVAMTCDSNATVTPAHVSKDLKEILEG